MKKLLTIFLLVIILIFGSVFLVRQFSIDQLTVNVLAEDDEKDEEDDDDKDNQKVETVTTVEYPEPRVEVRKNIQTITLNDSDGDGILDSEDPHPDVAEIYIVEDENRNGIVDKYEQ